MASKSVKTFSDINITPLTDIFLVLLIIMMVVAPMLNNVGLKLANPEMASTPETKTEPKVIRVLVTNNNEVKVDKQLVGPLTLRNTLREQLKTLPDGLVLAAEPNAEHQTLTRVIEAATTVGITKIALTEASNEANAEQAMDNAEGQL
jgi:biopolymer transport protein ExbD